MVEVFEDIIIQKLAQFPPRTVREDLSKCIKSYVKKCGTPLHREVVDLVIDQVTNQVSRFCQQGNPDRAGKLTVVNTRKNPN